MSHEIEVMRVYGKLRYGPWIPVHTAPAWVGEAIKAVMSTTSNGTVDNGTEFYKWIKR